MEREWKLGKDLCTSDNLLDGLTFDELILTVHCNCRTINKAAVVAELKSIVASRLEDMKELLERNIDRIMEEAKKGREV